MTVHVSDTGSGVHHSGVDVLQREDGGQELETIQKKEDKAWVLFRCKNLDGKWLGSNV